MRQNCNLVNDLLPLYVDDIISEEGKQIVEEHIESCDMCNKMYRQIKEKLDVPMDTDASAIKGLKKKYKMSMWLRVLIVVLALGIIWVAANVKLVSTWKEVWPKVDNEGVKNSMEIVQIGDTYYVHTNSLFGSGQVVYAEGSSDEVKKFYIGENGLHSLGLGRSWSMREGLFVIGSVEDTNKIVYARPDGTEEVTLFEKGDVIPVLEGEMTVFED